jgi:hypothetical protein
VHTRADTSDLLINKFKKNSSNCAAKHVCLIAMTLSAASRSQFLPIVTSRRRHGRLLMPVGQTAIILKLQALSWRCWVAA